MKVSFSGFVDTGLKEEAVLCFMSIYRVPDGQRQEVQPGFLGEAAHATPAT